MCSALCRILKLHWRSTLDAEGTYWDVAERDNKTRVTWWSVLLGASKVYFTFFKSDFDLGCYMLLLYPLLWSWFGQGNFSCGNFTWRLCKGPIECGSKELCHVFLRLPCALVISSQCFTDTHEGLIELCVCVCVFSIVFMSWTKLSSSHGNRALASGRILEVKIDEPPLKLSTDMSCTPNNCRLMQHMQHNKGAKTEDDRGKMRGWSLAVIIWARSLTYQIF